MGDQDNRRSISPSPLFLIEFPHQVTPLAPPAEHSRSGALNHYSYSNLAVLLLDSFPIRINSQSPHRSVIPTPHPSCIFSAYSLLK